jgi:hypothetical protein
LRPDQPGGEPRRHGAKLQDAQRFGQLQAGDDAERLAIPQGEKRAAGKGRGCPG